MPETPPLEGMAEVLRNLRVLLSTSMEEVLPALIDEVVAEIHNTIPDFSRPEGSPYNQVIRTGVERNVVGFIEWLSDPDQATFDRRDGLCRKMGAFEAMEGRPLAMLLTAYRIGAELSWAHMREVLVEREASAEEVATLAEALLSYMDQAAKLSREGYEQAKAEADDDREKARLLLLRAIVEDSGADCSDMATRYPLADWPIPDEVTLVALPAGSAVVRPLLDPDLLLDLHDAEPYLLVPGPLTAERQEMLKAALAGTRGAAAGLAAPTARAADSLRWARRLLSLVIEGVLDDGTLTLCENHMVSMWLLADVPLINQIIRKQLGFLSHLTDRQRERLTDTLRAWLRTRGPATRISEDLGVHVQTVRYRMRKLEQVLGEELTDPDNRFATEVALRALWLRNHSGRPLFQWASTGNPNEDEDEELR